MTTLFHPLRVRAIEAETGEAVIVSFDVPESLRDVFRFTQGQYLTLRARIDGQDLRRSYSICSGIDDPYLRVGVRKVRGGVFSNWINASLAAGQSIEVMVPQGRFNVPLEPELARHHVGIAGGSGITPILSIMKTALAREPRSRVSLIYGNRTLQSTMFKEELEDLKNRHLSRLALHYVFSDEQTDVPLNHGLMDRSRIASFLERLVPGASIDHAFVCGPFQMNEEAEAALLAAGVAQDRIHIERFGVPVPAAGSASLTGVAAGAAPGGAATVAASGAGVTRALVTGDAITGVATTGDTMTSDAVVHASQPGDASQATVVIVRDGLSRELVYRRDQPSILDSASAAGLEVPYSCTSGVCGTCRAKLVEGKVRMDRNFALDRNEVANGFVLTCQAHPLSARVVLSFDER